jgi:hypothetical protein
LKEDDDIEVGKLVNTARASYSDDVKKKTIDALVEYGDRGIAGIQTIVDDTYSSDLKMYGLNAIKSTRAKGNK